MNANVSPALPASASAEPAARPLDHVQIVKALAAIRTDSQREADEYLSDTLVPHGGE
jgi:hypothetical protein